MPVYSGLRAAGHEDVETGAHRGVEERRLVRGEAAERDESESRWARSTNLRMFAALNPRLISSSTTWSRGPHRVHERWS